LSHTHRFANIDPAELDLREPVSRDWRFSFQCGLKHCSFTGDFLKDTPADPDMSGSVADIGGVPTYIGFPALDCYDDTYDPDVFNIMSYGNRPFRVNFSKSQRTIITSRIWNRISLGLLEPGILGFSTSPDAYETDDDISQARLIAFGEEQERTFHLSQNPSGCGIDLNDWLIIDNKDVLEDRILKVSWIGDGPSPIDIESVLLSEFVDIANINDQSFRLSSSGLNNNEIIFSIPCDLSSRDNRLRFLLPKNQQSQITKYKVELMELEYDMSINANSQACNGDIISILNLPPNAIVNWSVRTGSLTLTGNSDGTATITNPLGTSLISVQADISIADCPATAQIVYVFENLTEVLGTVDQITTSVIGPNCNPEFHFSVNDVTGATGYEWSCNGSAFFEGCFSQENISFGFASLNANQGVSVQVEVRVFNDCGTSVTRTATVNYNPGGDCGPEVTSGGGSSRSVKILPNPTSGEFSIEIIETLTDIVISNYDIYITDPYGNTNLILQTDEKFIPISVNSPIVGQHYLHVVVEEEITTEPFLVE